MPPGTISRTDWHIHEQRRDIECVGDDVDRLEIGFAQCARDLRGRRARIENDGLAVVDEGDRGLGDADFFRVMLQLLDAERLILLLAWQRAAMRAHQRAG